MRIILQLFVIPDMPDSFYQLIEIRHPQIYESELSELKGVEFPMYSYENYDTKKYELVYLVGFGHCNHNINSRVYQIPDTLIKRRLPIYPSTTVYDPIIYSKANHYFQELVFVPDPDGDDEDDGVALSLAFDSINNK